MSFKNEDIPFTLVSRNKPTSSPQMTSSRDINPDKFKSVIGHLVYKKWIEKNEDATNLEVAAAKGADGSAGGAGRAADRDGWFWYG